MRARDAAGLLVVFPQATSGAGHHTRDLIAIGSLFSGLVVTCEKVISIAAR